MAKHRRSMKRRRLALNKRRGKSAKWKKLPKKGEPLSAAVAEEIQLEKELPRLKGKALILRANQTGSEGAMRLAREFLLLDVGAKSPNTTALRLPVSSYQHKSCGKSPDGAR
jgi:hypothetical protein